ncbi:TPA: HNH endonuclease [Vibrio parahaemolyticus]
MATIKEIRRRFELAPELPSGLRNRITITSRAKAGMMAGSLGDSYYRVQVQGKSYSNTHIIAMLANLPRWQELRRNCKRGKDVELVVDHIDGNTMNNASSNLRIISNRENVLAGYNTKKGTSRYRGVSWSNKENRWKAFIRCPDTKRNIYLGSFNQEQDAYKAYTIKAKALYPDDSMDLKICN